jgi:hypothetical protein
MLEDQSLRKLFTFVLVGAALMGVATVLFGVPMSSVGVFGFSITIALIVAGSSTLHDTHRPGREWNRHVSIGVNAAHILAIVTRLALLLFGFVDMPSMLVASGESAHHINAYVEQDVCWVVLNRDAPARAPADFCVSFNRHFGAGFSGLWLFLGGLFSTQAWRRTTATRP